MNYVVHSSKKHSVTIDRKAESSKSLEISVDKNRYTVGIRQGASQHDEWYYTLLRSEWERCRVGDSLRIEIDSTTTG